MTNQPDKDEEAAEKYINNLKWNPYAVSPEGIEELRSDHKITFLAGCKHKEDEILAKVRVYFEANEYMDLKPQRILDIIAGQPVPLPESLALKEKETPPQPEGEE